MEKSAGLDRRAFLTAAGVALLAAACGGGGGGALGSEDGDLDPATPAVERGTTAPPTGTTPGPTAVTGPAAFVVRGAGSAPQVALTFHTDGDRTLADRLLDTLAARNVPMTAFVVGEWLDANPAWASRLVDDGHELANHTYTHPTFATLGSADMRSEITRTRDLLVRLTGKPGRYFRPSGTGDGTQQPSDTLLAVAADAGYPVVLGFDVDPLDYQSPGPAAVAQRTLATVAPGAIVSLHFDYPDTVAALPAILDGLAARGLTPVTVSTLLGR